VGLCLEQYTRLHEFDLNLLCYYRIFNFTVAIEAFDFIDAPIGVLLLITIW
jgi:hypothetical protein